ncbi:SDR family NAD(P)-dependent oxidoreductase [Aestuariivirga sp.]|uniref:SDR family NAD(P)-dependent oxidoreductase n=1 Tax=Aestuariivirga sp. TaxID=2650926 RepID=UPI0039E68C0F
MYLEKFQLNGQIALVTGAGQGIGLACVEALAEAGANVIVTDQNESRTAAGAKALAAKGFSARSYVLDVTDTDGIDRLAGRLAEAGLTPDILVCNAGIAQAGIGAEEMPDADWARMIDINLTGVFRCCRAFGKLMLQKGQGSIINIGSMSGQIVNRPQAQSHYNTAKAGVHHLTRSMAAEWAKRGVRVNAVAPTYIDTPLLTFAKADPMFAEWLDLTPMGRLGRPDEIASAVLFLASDAASLLTGTILSADAGYTCW